MNAKRFLNGFVLVFLVTLGILSLPPVRTRVEKTLYPCKYSALVEQYAAEYDLDPLLVYSFVRTESGFDPDATSSVEARGLMQMTEETFLWLRSKIAEGENVTFGDLYDPAVSLRFGCYYLHLCMERYGGDVATAAAAYHSGWGTVDALLQKEEHSADGITLQGFPYNQMHHYDMNLCYMDELLWHFNWTGDTAYVRKMRPMITRHLAWEKLNYVPANDGLYDAYD